MQEAAALPWAAAAVRPSGAPGSPGSSFQKARHHGTRLTAIREAVSGQFKPYLRLRFILRPPKAVFVCNAQVILGIGIILLCCHFKPHPSLPIITANADAAGVHGSQAALRHDMPLQSC